MQSITAIIWVQAELPTERTLYHLCNLLLAGDQICEDAREVLWIFHRSKREKEHSWKTGHVHLPNVCIEPPNVSFWSGRLKLRAGVSIGALMPIIVEICLNFTVEFAYEFLYRILYPASRPQTAYASPHGSRVVSGKDAPPSCKIFES
eukprot:5926765-Pleurochrysis_carterae.AAC.2